MADRLQKMLLPGICLCLLLTCPSPLQGEDLQSASNRKSEVNTEKSSEQPKNRELNVQNEQLAHELVREHLPKLVPLLKQLKTDQPRQYERAVWDLARSAKKLNAAKKRDDQLFEVELEFLKAETEANLIAARLKVRDNPNDRKHLRESVARLHAAKQSKMRYEIEIYQKRLARDQALLTTAEQRLSDFEGNPKNTVAESYLAMLRKAGRKPANGEQKTKRQKPVTPASDE